MKIRKINDTTINCIITQDDLKKHGINLDDLFDRKKNAVEFIKGIILKAASTVNLNMKNDYTSMKLSVLPDRSVSLTISQDPSESQKIRTMKDSAGSPDAKSADAAGTASKNKAVPAGAGIFVFQFTSIMDMAGCSRMLAGAQGIATSVYYVEQTGYYYLVIEAGTDPDEGSDSLILRVNEFGKMVTCTDKTLAYMKEHSTCILRSRAAQQISELYS